MTIQVDIALRPRRPASALEPHFSCPMCRDEGLPGRVLEIDPATGLARVQLNEGEREVALDLVDGVGVGDFVLVHLDTAIAKLDAGDVVIVRITDSSDYMDDRDPASSVKSEKSVAIRDSDR